MLTEKERAGINVILQKLNVIDLISLTYTMTKGLVKTDGFSKNELIETTLKFTDKASTLLRRKKAKKATIFQYLIEEGVVLSSLSEKIDCISACLKHWMSPEAGQVLSSAETFDDEDAEMEDVEEAEPSSSTGTDVTTHEQMENQKLRVMGQTFATWFYSLLREGKAGPEHFWADASLRVYVEDTQLGKFGSFSNSADISHFLGMLVSSHQILLDPNTLSCKSVSDLYGTVTVEVSGVVHRNQLCIGLFDQTFGLVKDPQEENRWKIKYTNIKMKINCVLVNQILSLHQLRSA